MMGKSVAGCNYFRVPLPGGVRGGLKLNIKNYSFNHGVTQGYSRLPAGRQGVTQSY
jgi:hypothetical protein